MAALCVSLCSQDIQCFKLHSEILAVQASQGHGHLFGCGSSSLQLKTEAMETVER